MGNRSNRGNNDPRQNLLPVQVDNVDVALLVEQPKVKKVFAIKNPVYLKRETLSLERDSRNRNVFYIIFKYNSLVNFNAYFNFNVVKNPLYEKESASAFERCYTPAYTPSKSLMSSSVSFINLPRGSNRGFFEKSACIDMDAYFAIKETKKDSYDLAIEMVPLFEDNNFTKKIDKQSQIVFVTLCKFQQEENNAITKNSNTIAIALSNQVSSNYKIKSELQRLRSQALWIDMHEVFNSSLDAGECVICCSSMRNTIFLPCNHSCTCSACAHSLRMRNNPCPICKNGKPIIKKYFIGINDLLIVDTSTESKDKLRKG